MEIVSFRITAAHIHDVKLLESEEFINPVTGKLVGDKGYQVRKEVKSKLNLKSIELIAKQRINMDPHLNQYYAAYFKRRRCMEGIFGTLKIRFSPIFRFVRTIEAFVVHAKAAALTLLLKNALKYLIRPILTKLKRDNDTKRRKSSTATNFAQFIQIAAIGLAALLLGAVG